MADSRMEILARNLVFNSVKARPGEKVQIDMRGVNIPFANALIRAVYEAGALPFITLREPAVERELIRGCTDEQLQQMFEWEKEHTLAMDCYIGVRISQNSYEGSGVPFDQTERYNKIYSRRITNEVRVPNTRWVALRYPSPAMAQSAGMNTEEFEDFYFKVCNMDYPRMSRAMDPLRDLMERTDRVRILSPGTDLRFSIRNTGAVKCDGECNIPDGEVYSAPVRDSVEGYITYNTPSLEDGFTFENIHFEFSNGKIVKATANDSERLNKILDTDEGARYVGEFAFGVNPYVNRVMNDTLFDEKIGGSIHFTPGNCVMGCQNGNISQVHWDIVLIQTPEWGGGEIYFDDVLIRKDGRFVLKELEGLNPENLA